MNLGGPEILVIIVIGIMILGPDKLPSALRMFGKTMGEVKKYQDLAKSEIAKAMDSASLSIDVNTNTEIEKDELATKAKEDPLPKKSSETEKTESDDFIAPILDDED